MGSPLPALPEYENPPVSEVALSVEFLPLGNWRSPHAGLYWSRINKEYPGTEVQPPLPSQIERFAEKFEARPAIRLQMLDPDTTRTWFLADPPTRLIQVQRDRFVINWRKVRGDETYPRYEKEIRPRFEREWGHFKQFIGEQDLGKLDVQQCEVTYVNDIVQGEGWGEFWESMSLLAQWSGKGSIGFLPALETLNVSGSFRMPDERGRLHFAVQHVLRQLDQKEALQLQIVARGRPASSDDGDILDWMDFGREWIVRGFTDLTSRRAHEIWRRIR